MLFSNLVTGGLLIFQPVACAVLAIDYGTEWTKASLVKPGIPLEIVLTKDTKRKEQSVIAFKGSERLYGGDAANLAARLPAATFLSMKVLLGREYDSAEAKHFSMLYPSNQMIRTSRNSVAFEFGEQVFTVEELVAMQFINMRKNAELMADEAIRDVVMTVPPYFGQRQRQALLDTTRLAGLNCLEILNDGLAVALDYAKGRTFNMSQTHIIFDMGAGSTSATVVKFETQSVKDFGRFNKTVTNIVVLGSSHQTTASGNTMTERLYNHLREQFDATLPDTVTSKISTNTRALARLYKEATRVKQVLSANNEAVAAVESLHEGIDFKYKIARTKFEELNADLAELSTEPVVEALRASGLHATDVDSLILHGGAARVPFVQKALLEVIDESKIARNVNADEAAVMGAVFRGAALSGSFRVKEIVLQDLSSFNYLQADPAGPRSLYTTTSHLNTRRNLTLPRSATDFNIEFSETGHDEAPAEFLQLKVQGVANATTNLAALGCVAPEFVITTLLDSSMIFSVPEASITCDIEEKQGVADKVKGWFAKESTTSSTLSSKVNKSSAVAEAGPKIVRKKESLKAINVPTGILRNIRAEERIESLKKIKVFEQFDQERIALETARNGLEAFIYKIRDYLDSDGFQEVSTTDERQTIRSGAALANDWLYNEGESADLKDFVSQQTVLREKTNPILLRRDELQKRDAKIEALEKQIDASRTFVKSQLELSQAYNERKIVFEDSLKNASKSSLEEAANTEAQVTNVPRSDSAEQDSESDVAAEEKPSENTAPMAPSPPVYAERDIKTMETKLDEIEEWFADKKRQQQKLSKTDDPVLLSEDIEIRLDQLTQDFMAILMKASYKQKPKTNIPKKSKTSSKASAKTSSTTVPEPLTSFEDEDASATPMPDPIKDVPDAQAAEGDLEADLKVDLSDDVDSGPPIPSPGAGVRDEL